MERDPAGKRRRVETGSVGEPVSKLETASSTEDLRGPATRNGRVLTEAEIALAARPLPTRYPPFPTNGTIEDINKYNLEIVRVHRLGLQDPARNLPTVTRQVKDPITAAVTSSLRDKNAVLKAARSMVHVTSTASDGSRNFRCTGIIVGVVSDENGKHARILTSSRTVCTLKGVLQDPKPKLSIHLPNMTHLEGHLLFLNDHYRLALLDIMVDSLLTSASFGTSPQYGQEVFVLARDEDSSLVARRGTILFLEESSLGRNYNMFLSCEIPECGTGGPVIDHDGFVTGMAFRRNLDTAIIGISTILTCIEMWTQFRSVARPMLDMHLRSVELLDISLREQLSIQHNINRGFIVDKVTIDSTAERLGIRQGDVIVLDELYGSTLPQFEDFLLYHGWEYLRLLRNIQSHLMVDLKLEVHDLLGRAKRNVTLSIGLSDASERVRKNWNKHDSRRKVSTVSSEFDPDTAVALHSQQDRNMALAAACSIVSVSSTRAGDDNVFRCTGIVVAITSNEAGKCARILTSSRIFCSGDADLRLPEQKVFVHLSDKITVEGHILFLNIHYRIAILEILTDYPLRHVCFGDMPQYDQEVFLLGRDEESSIVVRRGSITLLEQSFLQRNYYMFLSCESGALQDLDCTGGLVIDKYGNMMGMIVAHNLQVAIMSITTVKICIDMWDKFSRIARPMIDMDLRSVELLEIEQKEKLSVHYNIERGFIVDKVRSDSSAWKNGIGEGDVMEIIDGECGSTLPQLEDYLLKLGWGCLDKCLDQLSTMDLKIRVHDIVRRTSKDIVIALEYDLV